MIQDNKLFHRTKHRILNHIECLEYIENDPIENFHFENEHIEKFYIENDPIENVYIENEESVVTTVLHGVSWFLAAGYGEQVVQRWTATVDSWSS